METMECGRNTRQSYIGCKLSCVFRKPTVLYRSNESIEQVFKKLSFGRNARSQLINGLVDDGLLQLSPNRGETLLQIVGVPHICLINAFLSYILLCGFRGLE